ncbi:uncharacterized protein LOC133031305 [Cannabis sativa]|uniref:uncharacterized protein LOC133031305 n=1 Tax=Cannabis sativa TaxID=3483 RepID=UPI0029CA4C84|nr:uncharacterized protein LOC133031305 [Cannabis sativa]
MVLPKHRFIGWQIVNNQLLTRDNLSRFLSISSPLCPVCCRENESHQHLFVHCCFTRKLTCEITKWCGQFDWPDDLNRWFSKAANNMQESIINTVILATLYTVWTNRNSCIFELSCKTLDNVDYVRHDVNPTEVANIHRLNSQPQQLDDFIVDDDTEGLNTEDDTSLELESDNDDNVVYVTDDDDDEL